MKKTLSIALVIILLASGLFILTGCNNENGNTSKNYNKEVETHTIERDDKAGTLTFELAKDLGYETEKSSPTNGLNFINNTDKSRLRVRFYYDYPTSSNITKEAKDFYSDKYQDYEKITLGGHEGWQIWEVNTSTINYKSALVLTEKDASNKVYAIGIEVSQSPLSEGASFNTKEFVASEDFVHMIESMKVEAASKETKEEANKVEQAYGEFAGRTDGYSDKDGLIFIPAYESPDPTALRAEQKNNNIGIDNYLWNTDEKAQYDTSGIEVRVFPQKGTYESIDAYKEKKGDMYTWSKTTIDGKEYDTFVFANSTKAAKYSDYYSGAFMVGNKVVEFSYNMYAEVKDQSVGPKFFTQIINSIEYSKEFKGESI